MALKILAVKNLGSDGRWRKNTKLG